MDDPYLPKDGHLELRDRPGLGLDVNEDVVSQSRYTHWQRTDHPLLGTRTRRPLAKFTRLEVYGSPFMGWVKVTVDANAPGLFRLEPQPYLRE